MRHLIFPLCLIGMLPVTAFAQTTIYQDDFEGAVSGWSVNTTNSTPQVGRFLGLFDNAQQETSRSFAIPAGSDTAVIELDLYRFDSWDNFAQFGLDRFEVDIDGTEVFSLPFPNPQPARSGTTGNVDWSHTPLTGQEELGFVTGEFWFDQLHRFEITVNNPGASVNVTLRADLNQEQNDESAGFDNFSITAFAPASEIVAIAETFAPIDGASGGTTTSVLSSDTLNGALVGPNDVTITNFTSSALNVSLDPSTGLISVAPNSPSGVFTVDYEICETTNIQNCSTVTETLIVNNTSGGGSTSFCPAGFASVPGTFNVVSATGGNNPNGAVGPPLPEGTVETANNAAVTFFGPITMDLTGDPATLVPQGEVIEVVLSSHFGTGGRAEILMSADGVNYTSLGTTGNGGSVYGAWQSNVLRYDDFTVPAGGARFLQVLHQNSGVRADGVIYGAQCVESSSAPELTLEKLADNDTNVVVGDTVTYTYTATNTGDVNIDDVTVSDVHSGLGPLSPITMTTLTNTSGNSVDDGADNDIDTLAPGDSAVFTASYQVLATDLLTGAPLTNTATATGEPASGTLIDPVASESVTLTGTPLNPLLTPDTCGDFIREGFLIEPGARATERNADFGSGATGPAPYDPYVLEPLIARNAATGVVSFFQSTPDAFGTGSFLSNGVALANSSNLTSSLGSDPNPRSEIWRVSARVEGAAGTTETITINNGGAHEHNAYWQTDINGAVINTNSSANAGNDDGWIFGADTATPGADGTSYTIDVTYPTGGIVILNFAVLDSTGGFGGVDIEEYTCPSPSLSMEKTAGNPGPYAAGDVITYTYTVTNDGNQPVRDIAINDTHNGSDPAPIAGAETLLTDAAPIGDSADANPDGSWDVLAPGDSITFTGAYTVTQIDAGNL